VHEVEKANLGFYNEVMSLKMPVEKNKQNRNAIVDVKVQCIINTKDIAADEELVLYRPAVAKKDEKKRVLATVESSHSEA
jgi:hypothetical protein